MGSKVGSEKEGTVISCIQQLGRSMRFVQPFQPIIVDECHFSAQEDPEKADDKAE